MSQFHITSANTEDRLDSTDNLQDAVRIARALARDGQPGEPICIEHQGKNIRQFLLLQDGKLVEESLVDDLKELKKPA